MFCNGSATLVVSSGFKFVVIVVVNMNNVVEAMVSVGFVLVWIGARFRGMLLFSCIVSRRWFGVAVTAFVT